MRGGGGGGGDDVRAAAATKVSSKTAAANADDHANAFTETISDLGAINRTREVVDAARRQLLRWGMRYAKKQTDDDDERFGSTGPSHLPAKKRWPSTTYGER